MTVVAPSGRFRCLDPLRRSQIAGGTFRTLRRAVAKAVPLS